jgi:hypothetical protein
VIDLNLLKVRIFVRGGNDQIVTALSQDFGERLGNFRKEGVKQIRNNQAHKIRTPSDQAASGQIGTIIKFLHAGENSLAGLLSDVRMIPQDLGDGDQGYSKVLGNVLHSYVHKQLVNLEVQIVL